MKRQDFRKIKRFIRFDKKSKRRQLIVHDKFIMFSWVLERFNENSQKAFIPNYSLTVDEQLFPSKARCPFTQYMPNKPDKFGIKFWVLVDCETKYCLNIKPYLSKDVNRVGSLETHVVMTLAKPYFNKGYNITMDNFFTSLDLTKKVLAKKTSVVGTMRNYRR